MKIAIYDGLGRKIAGDAELENQLQAYVLNSSFPLSEKGRVFTKLSDGSISVLDGEEAVLEGIVGVKNDNKRMTKEEMLKQLLLGKIGTEEKGVCLKYDLHYHDGYRVILAEHSGEEDCVSELAEIFEETLVTVVRIDDSRIALICPEGEDSATEIANAVTSSFNEVNEDCVCGISCVASGVNELNKAFEQSKNAIRVGRKIAYGSGVWMYSNLLPELMMSDMPQEKLKQLKNDGDNLLKTLDNEMFNLVLAFFEHNQNISETARYFPCHRNTLIYNLDKIQKETGLDLRVFDEAVSMRMYIAVRRLMR